VKCCDLTSGKLRHNIVFEQKNQVSDGGGGYDYTTEQVATVRAYIKPVSTNERIFAAQVQSDISHKIYIRYRTDLNAAMRINYNGRLFQVKGLMNIEEQNKWLEIIAIEGEDTW